MLLYQGLGYTMHVKMSYKNNKFKISAQTINGKFEFLDGSYSVSDIPDYFQYVIKNMKK